MKTPRSAVSLAVSLIFSAAFPFAPPSLSAANAEAVKPASPSAADKLAALPLEPSFQKEKSGDNEGLYSLTLKNVSTHALEVTGAVEVSVVSHNRPKSRTLPAQAIAPGKTWKIDGLAAHDKVTLTAQEFAPLQLTVP
jgi:hypothetical protein